MCNSLGIEHGIYREINLCSCKMWVFKVIVHPKRKISVIIYSLLSGSKPVWISAVENLRYIFEEHSEKYIRIGAAELKKGCKNTIKEVVITVV